MAAFIYAMLLPISSMPAFATIFFIDDG